MHLAHISDTHIAADGMAAGRREHELERTIETLNSLQPRPIAVVHTGDVAHNGREVEYSIARKLLARLGLPLVLTVGNRDDRQQMRTAFPELDRALGAGRFIQQIHDLGAIRVLTVDTMSVEHGLGESCGDRLDEVARLLSGIEPPIVVALHHPPVGVPSLNNAMQFRSATEAAALVKLIARQSGVLGVLAGHIHREDVAPVGATHLSTAASIAVDLRKGRYAGAAATKPAFLLHEIGARGLKTQRILVDDAAACTRGPVARSV